MNKGELKVSPNKYDMCIQNIITSIDNGYKLQELDCDIVDKNKWYDYNNSLILKPGYQREYRATVEEESLIIESILVGIPIPPVFLCTTRIKGVRVLNVVDGQHRLGALYRFIKCKFKLLNLPLLTEYEGKSYSDLNIEDQETIVNHLLQAYVFENFPGKQFELEVFNRYNKGTKNLTPQEIRNAVYASPHNDYITNFAEKLYDKKVDNWENNYKVLNEIYNVTKDRFLKKKVHEGIFCILYVLEYGIDESFKDSTTYATEYMKKKAELTTKQDQGYEEALKDVNKMKSNFHAFNEWLKKFTKITPYPFSRELYGISSKSYKFQTSMALIISALYKKIIETNGWVEKDFDFIADRIKKSLLSSYLEKPEYTASSTNSKEIAKLVNEFSLD